MASSICVWSPTSILLSPWQYAGPWHRNWFCLTTLSHGRCASCHWCVEAAVFRRLIVNILFMAPRHPRDKTPKEHQCGTIYNITCDSDSSHTYIGETKRTLSQRFKEHTNLDKPTGVGDHCRATGHSVSMKNTKIMTRESNWHKRKVKEAVYIRQRAPTMNRDQGYHLPAIYNKVIPPKSEVTHVTPVREQGP